MGYQYINAPCPALETTLRCDGDGFTTADDVIDQDNRFFRQIKIGQGNVNLAVTQTLFVGDAVDQTTTLGDASHPLLGFTVETQQDGIRQIVCAMQVRIDGNHIVKTEVFQMFQNRQAHHESNELGGPAVVGI